MPTLKEKLTDVSWKGFNVENIETIQAQLRQLIHTLHRGKLKEAKHIATIIKLRAEDLEGQIERKTDCP